jgi:hypothetical protein
VQLLNIESGFKIEGGGSMTPLPPFGQDPEGSLNDSCSAFAVNTPGAGSALTIVGDAYLCGAPESPCIEASDGLAWVDPGSIYALAQPSGFNLILGEAHDVNDSGQLVGWGARENQDCRERALFWSSPGDPDPIDLHSEAVPALPTGHASEAYAISNPNELGTVEIVGEDTFDNVAVLWTGANESWEYYNLNGLIDVVACNWVLGRARDVNDEGWIVGVGRHDNILRAFLLTPLGDCPADINGDGVVNNVDFLKLLGRWGECQTGVICIADIDGNCIVDNTDALLLIAAWGECEGSGGESAQPGQGGSGLSLPEAVQALGFADLGAYQAWATEANEAAFLASAELLAALMQGK